MNVKSKLKQETSIEEPATGLESSLTEILSRFKVNESQIEEIVKELVPKIGPNPTLEKEITKVYQRMNSLDKRIEEADDELPNFMKFTTCQNKGTGLNFPFSIWKFYFSL